MKEVMELLGGKVVIKDGEQYYVLLTMKEFKKIKQQNIEGLTKQELVDKINNDIASWKFVQEQKKMDELDLQEIGEIKNDEVVYEKTA